MFIKVLRAGCVRGYLSSISKTLHEIRSLGDVRIESFYLCLRNRGWIKSETLKVSGFLLEIFKEVVKNRGLAFYC